MWPMLRQRGMVLHGLPMRDAALVGLAFMEVAYPDEAKRNVEWRHLARTVGIPIVEDQQLKAQRRARQMKQVAVEFGDG